MEEEKGKGHNNRFSLKKLQDSSSKCGGWCEEKRAAVAPKTMTRVPPHQRMPNGRWRLNCMFLKLREMLTQTKGEIYLIAVIEWGAEGLMCKEVNLLQVDCR